MIRLNISFLGTIHALFLGLVTALLILYAYSIAFTTNNAIEKSSMIAYPRYLNNDTLIFASVIFRHGNTSTDSPGKPLRPIGAQQLFKTGQFLRRRYENLLEGRGYSYDRVHILSTDTERAIMSAQVCLAGMFPTTDENKWDDDILWHPIPMHTLPRKMDIYFRGGKTCDRYEQDYWYYMKRSPEALEIFEKYSDLIQFWSEKCGKNLTNLEYLADFHRKVVHNGTYFGLAERSAGWAVRSGFLLKSILEKSASKINSTLDPDRSIYMYSAHSSTLVPILNGIGIYEMDLSPFGSSLHFEVFKTPENNHYLQFFYRKPDEEYPAPLNVPGCGEKWTLEKFYSEHGRIIPGDFESECRVEKVNHTSH